MVDNRVSMIVCVLAGTLLLACGQAKPITESVEPAEETQSEQVDFSDTKENGNEVRVEYESLDEPIQEQPEEVELQETEPQEMEPPTATILMVGDVLLHTRVEQSATTEDGSFDFAPIFANVKDEVAAADLALVNQEVIIGGAELGISGYPAFNAPYEVADELVDTGFDVICHATNHALDKGKRGLINCLNYWQENYPDIAVLGIHDSREDQEKIYIEECEGMRIAILNYTYGTNGIALPGDMPYAVDLLKESRVREDLAKAEELADFTVVCPHWGTEYSLKKTAEQEKWVNIYSEGGADLVLGTHPHVLEPVEMVEGENGPMLVYYSLGNFVNWTSGTGSGVANRMVGGMAKVTITREEEKVIISDYEMLPLVTHVSPGFGGVTTYFFEDYSKELSDENAIRSQDGSFCYEYVEKLISEINNL
ncbi:MAG: CapA family protein [bacterium]|nr:CapA family protein [bacterium]